MRLLKVSAAAVLALALMCACSGGGAKNIDASKAAAEIVEKVEFFIRSCHKSTLFEKVSGLIGLCGPFGVDI